MLPSVNTRPNPEPKKPTHPPQGRSACDLTPCGLLLVANQASFVRQLTRLVSTCNSPSSELPSGRTPSRTPGLPLPPRRCLPPQVHRPRTQVRPVRVRSPPPPPLPLSSGCIEPPLRPPHSPSRGSCSGISRRPIPPRGPTPGLLRTGARQPAPAESHTYRASRDRPQA